MRRKRPYTEPDRIKERIQAIKDGIVFRQRSDAIAAYELETNRQSFAAMKIMNDIAFGTTMGKFS